MKDRVSQNPNRRLLTPENGSAPFYATVERADEPIEVGTPLNKGTLLSDATADLFGLSGIDATVNNALASTNNFAMLYWGGRGVTSAGLTSTNSKITGMESYLEKNPSAEDKVFIADVAQSRIYINKPGVYKLTASLIGSISGAETTLRLPGLIFKVYSGDAQQIKQSRHFNVTQNTNAFAITGQIVVNIAPEYVLPVNVEIWGLFSYEQYDMVKADDVFLLAELMHRHNL